MAFPSFISAGAITVDTSGGASTIPTPPAHLANDILLIMTHNAAGSVMTTATAGWTKINEVDGTINVAWFWKRATGAGTAGATVTAASTDQFAICYVIRGCITTGDPFENATTHGNGTTADSGAGGVQTSAINTTGNDRLVMAFAGIDGNNAFTSINPPAGWTADNNTASATGTGCAFGVISKQEASPVTPEAQVTMGNTAVSTTHGEVTLAWIPPAVAAAFIAPKPFIKSQAVNRSNTY